jgi:REP-associated tyrosine transposase
MTAQTRRAGTGRSRQQELRLERGRHGGRRPGAGRKPRGPRASERHETRPRVEPRHPLHVVIRGTRAAGRLRTRAGYRAVRHALIVTLRRHDFRICHVSIQATHIHLLVEADDRMALARGMQGFQIACARRFNQLRATRAAVRAAGRVFADRYHPVPLAGPRRVRHALGYVLGNWRRHGEDRGSQAVLDPFSSAAAFGGWAGARPASLDARSEPLPVCFPTTWLLAGGWRRAGPRLSPRARPGPEASARRPGR